MTHEQQPSSTTFIVERVVGKPTPVFGVHLWTPGAELSKPIWTTWPNQEGTAFTEVPSCYLAVDIKLYIGLSSACIDVVNLDTGKRIARYGPRPQQGSIRDPNFIKIRGLALHEGEVYDGSYAGLFKTAPGDLVDDRQIGSLETFIGRLLMVPHGTNRRFADSVRESHAGDLLDAISKEIVMERVEPFDGSGMSPGKHFIASCGQTGDHECGGTRIYMHHGNYPGERITIRAFPSGKIKTVVPLITTGQFVKHNGIVYDARDCPSDPKRDIGDRHWSVLRSDEGYEAPSERLFDVPKDERVISMASGGAQGGLLIALYNEEQNLGRIISHHQPTRPLLTCEGRLAVYKDVNSRV